MPSANASAGRIASYPRASSVMSGGGGGDGLGGGGGGACIQSDTDESDEASYGTTHVAAIATLVTPAAVMNAAVAAASPSRSGTS